MDINKLQALLAVFINGELRVRTADGRLYIGRIAEMNIPNINTLIIKLKWCAKAVSSVDMSEVLFYTAENISEWELIHPDDQALPLPLLEKGVVIMENPRKEEMLYLVAPSLKDEKYLDVNDIRNMAFTTITTGMSKDELEQLDPEMQEAARCLNAMETISRVIHELQQWGKTKDAKILEKGANPIAELLLADEDNVTDEEVAEGILQIKTVIEKLKSWGNEKYAGMLQDEVTFFEAYFKRISDDAMLEEFKTDWKESFELCHKLALAQNNTELADRIAGYKDMIDLGGSADKADLIDVIQQCRKLLETQTEVQTTT